MNDLDALPLGFNEQTKGKGIVNIGWAPQSEVLSHPSVGGSLFNGGWGAGNDALQYGDVLVLLPFSIDQGLIARLIVEKGVGAEIDRREDGSFSKDDIA